MKIKGDIYTFPPIEEWKWKTFDGLQNANVDNWIKDHINDDFYIGTDSQTEKKTCKFVTSLIAYRWGTGGCSINYIQKTHDNGIMRTRLISEALRSLTLAYYLDARIPTDKLIYIHLDVNANPEHQSNTCKEQSVGMFMSNSRRFRPMWKPDAWGASSVADRRTK
jgi:uncharacterized protein